jgi:hypothetical protein
MLNRFVLVDITFKGQGRFGRVFTAVNNRTGELMAMKEITLQPNDHRAIRSVADELRIFEGSYFNAYTLKDSTNC